MTIFYESTDHVKVIFSMTGTVWKTVLPFCVLNTLTTFGLHFLLAYADIDLTFPKGGIDMLTTMIAFLVVSRTTAAYTRFWVSRKLVSRLFLKGYQIAMMGNTFTGSEINPKYGLEPGVVKWRNMMKCRIINLIRASVDSFGDGDRILKTQLSFDRKQILMYPPSSMDNYIEAHTPETFPLPSEISSYFYDMIVANRYFLSTPLLIQEEMMLHNFASQYLDIYQEICKFIITPYPFPLVNMTKALVILWLFMLPFHMTHEQSLDIASPITQALTVFFMTYGFLGLECVAMELDDPFGDDHNDIELKRLAKVLQPNCRSYFDEDEDEDDSIAIIEDENTSSNTTATSFATSNEYRFCDLAGKLPFNLHDGKQDVIGANAMPGFITLFRSGDNFSLEGDHFEAIDRYKESLNVLRQSKDDEKSSNIPKYRLQEALVMMKIGHELLLLNETSEALARFEEAIPIVSSQLGETHEQVINGHDVMGRLYYTNGMLAKSIESFMLSLEGIRDLLGPGHELNSFVLFNLGHIHAKMLHLDWAMTSYLHCLSLQEKIHGVVHRNTARTLYHIACLHKESGDFSTAIKVLQSAIHILGKTPDTNYDLAIAITDKLCELHNQRNCSLDDDDFRSLRNAIRILSKKAKMANSHEIIIELMLKTGDFLVGGKKEDEAFKYYYDALRMHLDQPSYDSLRLAFAYSKIGLLCSKVGKSHKAVEHLKKALAIRREINISTNIEDIPELLIALGLSLYRTGNWDNGLQALDEANRYLKLHYDGRKREQAKSSFDLGSAFYEMGENGKAINCFELSLDIYRNTLDITDSFTAEIYYALGEIYILTTKEYLSAVHLFEEAFRIWNRTGSKSFRISTDALFKGAWSLARKGRFQRAISLYSQIISLETASTQAKVNAQISIGNIYIEINDLNSAVRCFDKVISYEGMSEECGTSISIGRRNIAIRLSKIGKAKEALTILQNNLTFVQNNLGDKHLENANTISDLGSVKFAWGEFEDAIQSYKFSLSLMYDLESQGSVEDKSESLSVSICETESRLKIAKTKCL